MESLNDFRAVIPDSYDPLRAKVRNVYEPLKQRQTVLRLTAALIERSGKKQRGKVRLEDVNRSLEIITENIDMIEAADPSLGWSVRNIDLDGTALDNLDSKSRK